MLLACVSYLRARLGSKKGQGMVEYGLIIGIVAVILIAALTVLKQPLTNLFDQIAGLLDGSSAKVVMPS